MSDLPLRLAQFVKWALDTGPFDGCELDGGDVQAKAEELGLIVPAEHRPDWWVFSPDFGAVLRGDTPSPPPPADRGST